MTLNQNKGILILLLFSSIVLLLFYDLSVFEPEVAIIRFLALFPFSLLVWSFIKNYKSKIDLIAPELFIGLSLFVGTTLRTIWLTNISVDSTSNDKKLDVLLGQDILDLFYPLVLINIGIIAFLIGKSIKFNFIKFNKLVHSNTFVIKENKLKLILFLGIIISIFGIFFLLRSVGVAQLAVETISDKRRVFDDDGQRHSFAWIRVFGKFSKYCFFLAVAYLFIYKPIKSKKIGILIYTALALITSVFYSLVTSSRSTMLDLIIITFIIIVISQRKIPKKLLLGVSFSFIIMAGIISSLRGGNKHDVQLGKSGFLESTTANNNLFDVSKTGYIASSISEKNNYYWGSTYITWLYAPIPREIWKDKPPVTPGLIVRKEIIGSVSSNNVGGGVPPGIIAESFMNFSLIGVFFMPMLLGALLQSFHRGIRHIVQMNLLRNIKPTALVIISIFVYEMSFKLVGDSITQSITSVLEAILVYFLIRLIQFYYARRVKV